VFADAPLYRSLASLHRAGVGWPQALASAGAGHPRWRAAEEALQAGSSLAEALAPVVPSLDGALLRAGEASGTLEATLERIANRHEAEGRTAGQRRTALAYPVVVGHIAALLAGFPDAFHGAWGAALLWTGALLAPLYLLLWATRPRRLQRGDRAHPGTQPPRAGVILRNAIEEADARALGAFADLFDAGLPLDETLDLAGRAGVGGRVAFDLYRARPRVRDGEALHTAWSAVPEDVAHELTVAEESGELGRVAHQIAARMQFGVEMRRKRFLALLPIVILLLDGAVVAYRVISFYTNLYANVLPH